MARDRQGRRQRRTRRPAEGPEGDVRGAAPGGPEGSGREPDAASPGAPLDAARDAGVEDVADERGPTGSTPTPDPLKHASPYVDEAKLAEAGEGPDAPSERTPERASDYAEAGESGSRSTEHAGRSRRPRAVTFLNNSADELRRVQWPDRRHTGQGTAVTLGFVVLAGGFLGLMDAIWKPLVEAII